jgi:hypothetical protein
LSFPVGENTNRGDPPLPVFSPATFLIIVKRSKSFLDSFYDKLGRLKFSFRESAGKIKQTGVRILAYLSFCACKIPYNENNANEYVKICSYPFLRPRRMLFLYFM